MRLVLLLFFLSLNSFASDEELSSILRKCFSSTKLNAQLKNSRRVHNSLGGVDLRFKINAGYSNNEISSNNPERLQAGLALRWEDVTDQVGRRDYHGEMIEVEKNQSKVYLYDFWDHKLKDFYYWKWGRNLKTTFEEMMYYVEKKLDAGKDSFKNLSVTDSYSNLLSLNQRSAEFLARIEYLDEEFGKCEEIKKWPQELDFTQDEILFFSKRKSNKLNYLKSYCDSHKKIKTLRLKRDVGVWGLGVFTSVNRNTALDKSRQDFNDIRMGLDLNIPFGGERTYETKVDSCDYQAKTFYSEDMIERKSAESQLPVLRILKKQFHEFIKKSSSLNLKKSYKLIPTQDVISLGLNLHKIHETLAQKEAQINSRILSSKIVENEI